MGRAELFDVDALLAQARAAQRGAYVPYSGFRVGAALLTVGGAVYTGANVENAALPATICAERVALPAAVVAGERDFRALAVVGDGDGPTTPCGLCRQVLFEFAPELVVVSAGATGLAKRYVLGPELLPDGFGAQRIHV